MQFKTSFRFILFASLAIVFSLFLPDQAISQTASSQTASSPHAPCKAFRSKNVADKKGKMQTLSEEHTLSGTQYNCGNPTDEEQLMLEYINFARANPDSEGVILSTTQDPGVVNEYNGFPSSSRTEVATDFPTYPSRPPLAMNADLLTVARGHDQAMITYDSEYHVGPDGSPESRINAVYPDWSALGENVFAFGDSDVFYDDAAFLIDFGNSGLGHRHNIMNFASDDAIYTEVGLGMVAGNGSGNPNGDVGPVLTTEDFVLGPKVFVLGVVYSDSNQNGFYDEGEGDAGVTITLSSGSSYYAVTSSSGGYAIPFTGSGVVTVMATGGPFSKPVTKQVELNGVNIKVDFSPDLSGLPTLVTLVSPVSNTVNTSIVTFIWDTVSAPDFHIQIATDAQFKNLIKNDSTVTTTSVVVSGLQDSTTYYWRVQGKNLKQVGQWSTAASFFVDLPPSTVVLDTPVNGAFVGDTIISFAWQASDHSPYGYYLIICSDKAMMDTVVTDMPQLPIDAIQASFFLTAGQTYYWEVLADNEAGWSAPSVVWSFTTSSQSLVADPLEHASSVTISPNPSTGSAELQFMLPTSEDVSLRVFNALGEQVQSVGLGYLSAGTNEYVWDGSGLLAGSYVCQLRMRDQIQNTRVVILK